MGGEDGTFLPGYEMREVVAREVGAALGFSSWLYADALLGARLLAKQPRE